MSDKEKHILNISDDSLSDKEKFDSVMALIFVSHTKV